MKIILCLLLVLPSMQTWKTLHYNIKVQDQGGKPVPDCVIECSGQGIMGTKKCVTDKTGTCNFTFPTQNIVSLSVKPKSHKMKYLNLTELGKRNDGDTVYTIIKVEPYTHHQPK